VENPKTKTATFVAAIFIVLCCLCLSLAGLGGYAFFLNRVSPVFAIPDISVDFPAPPTPEPEVTRPPVDQDTLGTREILELAEIPPNDPVELACRLEGVCNIPETMAAPAAPRVAGEADTFWVTNITNNDQFQVHATLQYVTPHLYFWVEDGVNFNRGELTALADAFEEKIYPTNREFFGSEWSPGIDGDEHIYILYAGGLGFTIAGYFSTVDELHPLAHEYSNAHEMFLFNADTTRLGNDFTYGVLAHEFQHMIHWYQDRNETSWMNEGFSEVAAFLNGYNPGGFDALYISNTDLQLNDWPTDRNRATPHYGSGFLYLLYFLDRFGEDATRMLAQDQANGFDGVENVLNTIQAVDALTGQPITADDFFMDWAVTNYLLDGSAADGRFTYHNYPSARRASAAETIARCPQEPGTRSVHQFGVDAIAIQCAGDYTISFTGSTVARLLPADPYSGSYAFWSNKGDESDMTLTREFDFSGVDGPIMLSYQTWYDLEKKYDYVYLEASEDGVHWQILSTPSGTPDDPTGASRGWAYNGATNGWITEEVSLSQYAGRKVQVRFEYVTDGAVLGEGFLLDDISIDAIDYRSDFEADEGGWLAKGFVRVQNVLPQTFRLALLLSRDSSVQMIPVNADRRAEIPFSLKAGETAYLVITGTTRITREMAAYQIEIR
jgi:hypothetical protein